jgi:alkyl hydroperoxide reductase subunit AhpC
VYNEKTGEAERALFVIDAKGVIRWSYVSPVGINPGADGIFKALTSIAQSRDKLPAAKLARLQIREEA